MLNNESRTAVKGGPPARELDGDLITYHPKKGLEYYRMSKSALGSDGWFCTT
jgi:hypothetical protein